MSMTKSSCTKFKIAAIILAAIATALLIAAFFTPPHFVIDSSVLAAVGEMFAFAALFMGWEAIDRGLDAKVTHGNTTIELNNPDNPPEAK